MTNFNYEVETLALEKPRPKLDAVLKIQGYKDPAKVRSRVVSAAQTAIEGFSNHAEPTVSYRIVKISSIDDKSMTLGNNAEMISPIFFHYLGDSQNVVAFVLTVGKGIDDQTIEWMDQDKLVEALFLESAAWLGVEDATKQFVLFIRSLAAKHNARISRRLGPGYSYPISGQQVQWDLLDQKPLFELFGNASIPVTLLSSSAMLPKMSRSGLFGLIPKVKADQINQP